MSDAHAIPPRGRTVSVVLLSFNHAATVGEALRSAIDQSTPADEVIVSDDHSTDGSWETLSEIAAGDPRVRLVRPPSNVGMAANANFAVAQSTGDYVALLHHDDLYRHDMIERWQEVARRYDDVAFVFNRYVEAAPLPSHGLSQYMDGRVFLDRLLATWGCPVRGTALIRRACWDAVGGLRERFDLLADVDLWMRLSARWAVGYVDEALITVRHARPEGYPNEYVNLSWRRNRLLYEIHAANTPAGAARWLRLRARVSLDSAKWIAYAAVRRPALLVDANEGATTLELAPVRLARAIAARRARRGSGSQG